MMFRWGNQMELKVMLWEVQKRTNELLGRFRLGVAPHSFQ